jgi:D-glucosaminate-specific PTS system IID component
MNNMNKDEQTGKKEESIITRKDVNKLFFRWYVLCEMSNSFERLQSIAVCSSLSPSLKKLYPDEERFADALTRHLQFFNTEGIFGSVIHGTALAMEEQKSKGEEIPGEMITNIKTGLMGAMAGIGDTLTWGTLRPILLGLAASFAMKGSGLGVVFPFLFVVITYLFGNYFCNMGYSLGKESVKTFLQGGVIKDVIYGAGILGVFMMGALAANYVDVTTPFTFVAGGEEMVVQDMLDGIVRGFLPLAAVMGIYAFLRKHQYKLLRVLIIIVLVCFFGALTGLL